MSEEFGPDNRRAPISAPDFVMGAIGALIAIPLCEAGWSAVVNGEHITWNDRYCSWPFVLLGSGSFHWWKTHVGGKIKDTAERHAGFGQR
jgi:hypothetical protein